MNPLPVECFERPVVEVARDLIGCLLTATEDGEIIGRIVETEAYGMEEEAFFGRHASLDSDGKLRTSTTGKVLLGARGVAFVYNVFFGNWLLNIVAGPPGYAGCVLIRAAELKTGVEVARIRSGDRLPAEKLASGPGRLTRSFGIDGTLNGHCMQSRPCMILESGQERRPDILAARRIGVKRARSLRWRYLDPNSPSISRQPDIIADSTINP